MRTLFLIIAAISLTACSTLSLDKDRAAEQQKQELCRDIETRNLPQCAGSYVPPTPTT